MAKITIDACFQMESGSSGYRATFETERHICLTDLGFAINYEEIYPKIFTGKLKNMIPSSEGLTIRLPGNLTSEQVQTTVLMASLYARAYSMPIKVTKQKSR